MKKNLLLLCCFGLLAITAVAQNIFSGERVMVVGAFNGYAATPYGTDYRTTTYRRVSLNSGAPVDGRGQWATTINVQSSGGDVMPINMAGGAGNGFLFISGPAANRFQNKWVFSGIGQGTVDAINVASAFNSGNDMGLNMSAAGYYTFVFNDAGYTPTNASYYAAYTAAAPVTVSHGSLAINLDGSATINISTGATPSAEEKIYLRYTTGIDFSGTGSSSIVQATGSGTSYSANIPSLPAGTVVRYYTFSSTRTLAQLTANTEIERSLAVINYDDNAGANYNYVVTTLPLRFGDFAARTISKGIVLNWTIEEESGINYYEAERSVNGAPFINISRIAPIGNSGKTAYEVTDNNPVNGNNYYRIKMVHSDGRISYSDVLHVKYGKGGNNLLVYPNPVIKDLRLQMTGFAKGRYELSIISSNGQSILRKTIEHNGADNLQTILLPDGMQKGSYIIQLIKGTEYYKQSFIKQ
jgi:hypothetical protein